MDTAKIFTSGNSQAVRLPKAYRFDVAEVYIKRTDQGILLIPKSDKEIWHAWIDNLMAFEEPLSLERDQGAQQLREGLDALFD